MWRPVDVTPVSVEPTVAQDDDDGDPTDDVAPQETLRAERNERLTDPDEFASLDRRPIGEWVAIICEHLGVPFDAPLWVDDDPELEVATPRPTGAHDPGPSSPHPAARSAASFKGRGPSP